MSHHFNDLHPSMYRPTFRVEYLKDGTLMTEYITGDTAVEAERRADARAEQVHELRGVAVSVFQHTDSTPQPATTHAALNPSRGN